MTFPAVVTESGGTNAATTSHTITLPASIAAGNLLIVEFTVLVAVAAAPTITWPGSWALIANSRSDAFISAAASDTIGSMAVGWLQASGGETSITVTTSNSAASAYRCLRISGHRAATAPEAASVTAGTQNDSSPNCPNLAPAAGAEDLLWLAMFCHRNDSPATTVSAYPTNYANDATSSGGANLMAASLARRNLNASSENPGVATLSGSRRWMASTVAVRPAAVAGSCVGAASGTSTGSAVGAATAASIGSASGTSTAAATASTGAGVGSAAGTSTAAAVGAKTSAAIGQAAGSSTAVGSTAKNVTTATLTSVWNAALAGDVLLLADGNYGVFNFTRQFASYVTIQAANLHGAVFTSIQSISGGNHIRFDGLRSLNTILNDVSYIEVINCLFRDDAIQCVKLLGDSHHVLFEHNELGDIVVTNPDTHPDLFQSYANFGSGAAPHDVLIRRNLFWDNPATGLFEPQGCFLSDPGSGYRHILVEENFIQGAPFRSLNIAGGVEDVILRNNTIMRGNLTLEDTKGANTGTLVQDNITPAFSQEGPANATLVGNLIMSLAQRAEWFPDYTNGWTREQYFPAAGSPAATKGAFAYADELQIPEGSAVGSAAGTSTATAVGARTAASSGSATGAATLAAVGASIAAVVGSASGTSTAAATGDILTAGETVGSAVGAATATGVGASTVEAVGQSQGTSIVTGVGSSEGGVVVPFPTPTPVSSGGGGGMAWSSTPSEHPPIVDYEADALLVLMMAA